MTILLRAANRVAKQFHPSQKEAAVDIPRTADIHGPDRSDWASMHQWIHHPFPRKHEVRWHEHSSGAHAAQCRDILSTFCTGHFPNLGDTSRGLYLHWFCDNREPCLVAVPRANCGEIAIRQYVSVLLVEICCLLFVTDSICHQPHVGATFFHQPFRRRKLMGTDLVRDTNAIFLVQNDGRAHHGQS